MEDKQVGRLKRLVVLGAAAAFVTSPGCAWYRRVTTGPQKVPAQAFYQPSADARLARVEAASTTADATTGETGLSAGVTPATAPSPEAQPDPQAGMATESAQPAASLTPAASAPKPAPISTTGTYMTIGGVVSEVNGVPIFSSRVLKELEPVLAARARELDERPFQQSARELVERQIRELELEELTYASAQRNLDADDKKIADVVTTDWRQKKIIEAGGSLQQARRIALDAGENFDDLVRRENRRLLIQLYYQKKIIPRIQVTTSDMRKFYRDNVDKMFTDRTEATFRLLRVDPARNGGKQPALDKLLALRDRVNKGEDFATLATTSNDDAALSRAKGLVGPISRGSLALEKVEEAVFKTEPGSLTEILEDRGGYYIARVESRKLGSVKPFEDPAVQERVREELRKVQISQMRQQAEAELTRNAVIRRDPRMLQTALEMTAQRYPIWKAR